jgi:hypothetical protein
LSRRALKFGGFKVLELWRCSKNMEIELFKCGSRALVRGVVSSLQLLIDKGFDF